MFSGHMVSVIECAWSAEITYNTLSQLSMTVCHSYCVTVSKLLHQQYALEFLSMCHLNL